MKGLLFRALFCPLHRGKSGAARIGGGERSEPVSRMVILPYDTESKSRNVLASPLGEEGHEVAKGWTVVRMIMILNVDVTAEGGIIKLIAPSRGNERYEGKNSESYTSGTISAFPLWWLAPPPCPVGSMSLDSRVAGLPYESSSFATPASGGTIKLRYAVSCL